MKLFNELVKLFVYYKKGLEAVIEKKCGSNV